MKSVYSAIQFGLILLLQILICNNNVYAQELDKSLINQQFFVESPYSTADAPIYFLKTNNGFVVFEKGKVTYQNIKVTKKIEDPVAKGVFIPENINVSNTVVRFDGSNLESQIIGNSKSLFPINYFLSDVPEGNKNRNAFSSILMKDVYDGIDIKYYFQNGLLKYDVIAKAHSDLSLFKMRIEGDDLFSVVDEKTIQLNNFNSPIEDKISYSYQTINSELRNVNVRFQVKDGVIGFIADSLDSNYELVIDPSLLFSSYIGGSNDDYEYTGGISKDNSGNIVVTGRTLSVNFPTTAGSYQTSSAGNIDCVVFKLNATGNTLLFATYIGGASLDAGYTTLVNPITNEIYVGGTTASNFFPTVNGAFQTTYGGGAYDGFVVKLNNSGSLLISSTLVGNSQQDLIASICFDNNYDIVFVGQTTGTFISTGTGFQNFYGGGPWDVFIGKINQSLSSLLFTTMLGGSGDDHCHAVKVDATGNICIMGFTSGSMPVSPGSYDQSYNGGIWDTYCAKMNASLSQNIFCTYIGSSGDDWAWNSIEIDNSGNIYVAGYTNGNNFPTTIGCVQSNYGGGLYDAFIYKLSNTGVSLLNSTYLGSTGDDEGWGIVCDNNEPIVTGTFQNGLIPQPCSFYPNNNGLKDAFYLKLDSTFSSVINSSYFGGQNDDVGNNILLDGTSIIIAGATSSTNFPTSFNAYDKTHNGGSDFFVLKFQAYNVPPVSQFIADTVVCFGTNILFQNSSTNGQNYLWDFGDNTTSTLFQPIHNYSIPGNYTVALTVDNCISVDVAYLNIEVLESPTAAFSYSIDCNREVTLTADSSALNYLWNLGSFGSSIADSVNFNLGSVDSIVVSLISSNGGTCSDTLSKTIISNLPLADFTTTVTPCTHQVLIQPTQSVFNTNYNWTIAGLQSQNNGQDFYITVDSLDSFQIELIALGGGCSDTIIQNIQFDSLPVAQFSTTNLCSNPVQFVNTSSNYQSATWYFGNGDSTTATDPLYQYSNDGNYLVSLIVQNTSGCNDTLASYINVHTAPVVQVVSILDSCSGNFTFQFIPDLLTSNSIWDFGDGTILQNSNYTHYYNNSGIYSVNIIVNPNDACPDTIKTTVEVNEYSQGLQYLPNCFTPNEDSVNDTFELQGAGFCNYMGYSVYNRWGQLLFTTKYIYEKWDGKLNGSELPEGVYVVTLQGENPVSFFITLMR